MGIGIYFFILAIFGAIIWAIQMGVFLSVLALMIGTLLLLSGFEQIALWADGKPYDMTLFIIGWIGIALLARIFWRMLKNIYRNLTRH